MNFGTVWFPSKEVQDIADSYRKRYDPHYNLIAPHITVREAENWDEARLSQALAHLEQVTEKLAPFSICFNRFSSFQPQSPVIYLALDETQEMNRLYGQVCAGVLAEPNKAAYTFTPHLTVGQQMGPDELNDVLASLKNIKIHLACKVERLDLLQQAENGVWSVYQTFLLRG